jgi:hypothetical protein
VNVYNEWQNDPQSRDQPRPTTVGGETPVIPQIAAKLNNETEL